MTSPRPVGAAAIATLWGQEVHDAVHTPAGGLYTSNVHSPAANAYVKLAMVNVGAGALLLDAGDVLIARAGLYQIIHQVNPSAGASGTVMTNELRLNAGLLQQVLTTYSAAGFQSELSRLIDLAAGDRLALWAKGVGAGFSFTGVLYVVRIGEAFGS